MPQELCEALRQHLDAIKRSLILNKPTHHIMHVIYQHTLCGSLYFTFSLVTFPSWHACFFFLSIWFFFQLFPYLFPPKKLHTIPYTHSHFVLPPNLISLSTVFSNTILSNTAFLTLFLSILLLSLSFHSSKAP